MKDYNLDLYLVTDRKLCNGRSLIDVVKEAVAGGVDIVQLREKNCSDSEFIELASQLMLILKPLQIPLIINDNIEVAKAVKADGLHIGQGDISYLEARKILGKDFIIGLSVESVDDALKANDWDVDYLGLSPIFSTPTKTDIHHELGLEGIRKIKEISTHKLVAIGGINETNCVEIVKAGADGVAVVSAICSSENPRLSSEILKDIVLKAK